MSYFGLDPVAERKQLAHAAENPVRPQEAGFFDGVVMAPVDGLWTGARKVDQALYAGLDPVISPISQAINEYTPLHDSSEEWLRTQRDLAKKSVAEMVPDAATTGTAGQVLHSLFDIGSQALLGTLVAGPSRAAATVSSAQGVSEYEKLVDKGVDAHTAKKTAAITGVTMGVGTMLPMSIGLRSVGSAFGVWGKATALGGDVVYAAGSNMAMGMAQRGFTHDLLNDGGYEEMARQYQVMDQQALAIDAILGVAFGGAGHFLHARTGERATPPEVGSAEIDAALTANAALHVEIDTAPGIPADPISRTAHVNAMNKALADISAGRPVDVAGIISDANFIPKDMNAFIRDVSETVSEFYPEIPFFYLDDGSAVTAKAVSDHITLLQPEAGAVMNRAAREAITVDIGRNETLLSQLSSELATIKREPLRGSGKALAEARAARAGKVSALTREMDGIRETITSLKTTLADHVKGGRNFEAKADISRLQQGVIPERLRQSIVRQSAEELGVDLALRTTEPASPVIESTPTDAKTSAERSDRESAAVLDSDARMASHALLKDPDMVIHMEDASGAPVEVKAADVMAEADRVIKQAEQDASLFDAAVVCFLGGRT